MVPSFYLVSGGNVLDCLNGAGGLGVHADDPRGYMDSVGDARAPSFCSPPESAEKVAWMFLMVVC